MSNIRQSAVSRSAAAPLMLPRLELIHAQNNRILGLLERMGEDMRDIKIRTAHTEEGLAGVNRRLDRMDDRLARIEHQLDIADAPTS